MRQLFHSAILVQLATILLVCQASLRKITPITDEKDMNAVQMMKYHGYPVMTYDSLSEDGYRSTLHRIPGKRHQTVVQALKEVQSKNKRPVLVLHGISGSSHALIVSGPGKQKGSKIVGKAFPYQLADTGRYDVWMMNMRGNHYSRSHLWLDAETEQAYWDFSFEEVAKYDVPAAIELIQKNRGTKPKKVSLIGYSQGTTISLTALSHKNLDLAKKVNFFVALAPAINFKSLTENVLRSLASAHFVQNALIDMAYLEMSDSFGGKNDFTTNIRENYPWMCSMQAQLCHDTASRDALDNLKSVDLSRADPDRIDIMLKAHGGTSLKNFIHMGQLITQQKFQHFDYGSFSNYKRYGQWTPKLIDMRENQVPTAMFVARHDAIADLDDNLTVRENLGDKCVLFEILEDQDHLSLSFSKDMTYFNDVIQILDKYDQDSS